MTYLQFSKLKDNNWCHQQAITLKSNYSAKTADKNQEKSPQIHRYMSL